MWDTCKSESNKFATNFTNFLKKDIDIDEVYGCFDTDKAAIAEEYLFIFLDDEIFCEDYENVKIWEYLQHDVVPIILSLPDNYSNKLPKNSYINAANFPTAKNLVNYLRFLEQNKGRFIQEAYQSTVDNTSMNPSFFSKIILLLFFLENYLSYRKVQYQFSHCHFKDFR